MYKMYKNSYTAKFAFPIYNRGMTKMGSIAKRKE